MNRSTFRIIAVGLTLCGTLPVWATANAADKVPLPTDDEIAAAAKRIDAKFAREVARARSSDAKGALYDKLDDELKKLDDPADVYALLRKIISLSGESYGMVERYLGEIDLRFEGDVLSIRGRPSQSTEKGESLSVSRGGIFGQRGPGFDGTLDELAIYGRALTEDEIDTIYRMGVLGKHFVK